jgi:hypothetical protein
LWNAGNSQVLFFFFFCFSSMGLQMLTKTLFLFSGKGFWSCSKIISFCCSTQCPSICATNDYYGQWWWHPLFRLISIPCEFFPYLWVLWLDNMTIQSCISNGHFFQLWNVSSTCIFINDLTSLIIFFGQLFSY